MARLIKKKVSCNSDNNCPKVLSHMLGETINSLLCKSAQLLFVYRRAEPRTKANCLADYQNVLQLISREVGFSV